MSGTENNSKLCAKLATVILYSVALLFLKRWNLSLLLENFCLVVLTCYSHWNIRKCDTVENWKAFTQLNLSHLLLPELKPSGRWTSLLEDSHRKRKVLPYMYTGQKNLPTSRQTSLTLFHLASTRLPADERSAHSHRRLDHQLWMISH